MILSENIENYFGGEFAFSTTLKNQNIVLIDKEEKRITTDLLGYELFKQFNNDLINGLPVTQKWIDFVNGIDYVLDGVLKNYTGIIEMLQYYTLSILTEKFQLFQTGIGIRKLEGENSLDTSNIEKEQQIINNYNNCLPLYRQAYDFLYNNNEIQNRTATSIIDNLDNTYTVNLTNTTDICDYQKVILNGKEYEVTNLISNTSFNINENTGVVFNLDFQFFKYGNLISIPKYSKKIINY